MTSAHYAIPRLLVEHDTPGVEGYLGLDTEPLQINGFFKGVHAQNDLSILEQMTDAGDPINVKIYGHAGETFVSANYLLEFLEWQPEAGHPSQEGAMKLLYRITLHRNVT